MQMARPKEFDPDEVLDGVVEVFRDLGFARTSLVDLTTRVGIGRQSLYDTFGSKDDLWSLALERYRSRQGQAMLEALADDDVLAGIGRVLHWLIDDIAADPLGCFVVGAVVERVPGDPRSTAQVRDQFAAIVAGFAVTIRRGQVRRQVAGDVDAETYAELLLTVIQGLRVVGKVRPDVERMRRMVAAVLAPLGP